jgi:Fe2+ or Zn2+ uptake regulation protein
LGKELDAVQGEKMEISVELLKKELEAKKIHLSYQRLKVLEYLVQNRIHPTADKIYTDLQKVIPTLSKTTIYNTLKILVEADLVKLIKTEESEARYDIDVKTHGHFKCESCGEVFDFAINLEALQLADLKNCRINEKNVYFRGFCPGCQ